MTAPDLPSSHAAYRRVLFTVPTLREDAIEDLRKGKILHVANVIPEVYALFENLRRLLSDVDGAFQSRATPVSAGRGARWTLPHLKTHRSGSLLSSAQMSTDVELDPGRLDWGVELDRTSETLAILGFFILHDRRKTANSIGKPPYLWLVRVGYSAMLKLYGQAERHERLDPIPLQQWCFTVAETCFNRMSPDVISETGEVTNPERTDQTQTPLERLLPMTFVRNASGHRQGPLLMFTAWYGRRLTQGSADSVGVLKDLFHFRSKKAPFHHEFIVAGFAPNGDGAFSWIRFERAARSKASALTVQADSSSPALSGVSVRETVTFASSLSELSSNSNELAALHINSFDTPLPLGQFLGQLTTTTYSKHRYQLFTTNCRWFARRAFMNILQWCDQVRVPYSPSWRNNPISMANLHSKLAKEWFGGAQTTDRRSKALEYELRSYFDMSKKYQKPGEDGSSSLLHTPPEAFDNLDAPSDSPGAGEVDLLDETIINGFGQLARAASMAQKGDHVGGLRVVDDVIRCYRSLSPDPSRPDAAQRKASALHTAIRMQYSLSAAGAERQEEAITALREGISSSAILGPNHVSMLRGELGNMLYTMGSERWDEAFVELEAAVRDFKLNCTFTNVSWSNHLISHISHLHAYADILAHSGRVEESYILNADGVALSMDLATMSSSVEPSAENSYHLLTGLTRILNLAPQVHASLGSLRIVEEALPHLASKDCVTIREFFSDLPAIERRRHLSSPDDNVQRKTYIDSLLACAVLLSRMGAGDDAIDMFETGLKFSSNLGDREDILRWRAYVLWSLALTFRNHGQYHNALSTIDKFLEISQRLVSISRSPSSTALLRDGYLVLSRLHSITESYDGAIRAASECERLRPDKRDQPDVHSLASLIYRFLGQTHTSTPEQTLQTAEEIAQVCNKQFPGQLIGVASTVVTYAEALSLQQGILEQPISATELLMNSMVECGRLGTPKGQKALIDALAALLTDLANRYRAEKHLEVALVALGAVIELQTSQWSHLARHQFDYEDVGRGLISSYQSRAAILFHTEEKKTANKDLASMTNMMRLIIHEHRGHPPSFFLRIATEVRDTALKEGSRGEVDGSMKNAREFLAVSRLAFDLNGGDFVESEEWSTIDRVDLTMDRVLGRFAWLAHDAGSFEEVREVLKESIAVDKELGLNDSDHSLGTMLRIEMSADASRLSDFIVSSDDTIHPMLLKGFVLAALSHGFDDEDLPVEAVKFQKATTAIFSRINADTTVLEGDDHRSILLAQQLASLACYLRKARSGTPALELVAKPVDETSGGNGTVIEPGDPVDGVTSLKSALFQFKSSMTPTQSNEEREEALVKSFASLIIDDKSAKPRPTVLDSTDPKVLSPNTHVVDYLLDQSLVHIHKGTPHDALQTADTALARCNARCSDDLNLKSCVLAIRAEALDGCGRHAEARRTQNEVIVLLGQARDKTSAGPDRLKAEIAHAQSHAELARYFEQDGQYDSALSAIDVAVAGLVVGWKPRQQASDTSKSKYDSVGKSLCRAYELRERLLEALGRFEEARGVEEQKKDIEALISPLPEGGEMVSYELFRGGARFGSLTVHYSLQREQKEKFDPARNYLLFAHVEGEVPTTKFEAETIAPLETKWSQVLYHFCRVKEQKARDPIQTLLEALLSGRLQGRTLAVTVPRHPGPPGAASFLEGRVMR